MRFITTLICLIIVTESFAQTELKNYLNSGFGLYIPYHSSGDNIGNLATLNLEVEFTKHSIARLSIDNYRIPLLKEINYNNTTIKSNTSANINSLGLDYGLRLVQNKWRFYAFIGGALCFIDEPQFSISNNSTVLIDSKNVTRFAFRISPGVEYHFTDTFILFTELQGISIFYKNQDNKNLLNGSGFVLGVATKI
jgi:hypothetical protein